MVDLRAVVGRGRPELGVVLERAGHERDRGTEPRDGEAAGEVLTPGRSGILACALLLSAIASAPVARAQEPSPTISARTRGSATAPITVYELSDFQCPFCREFTLTTFPALEKEYIETGKVRWVFINFPLTGLHPNAAGAAEVGLCAAKQGKFWPVHDLLFLHQRTWAPLAQPGEFFISLADSARLEKPAFRQCLADAETQPEVRAEATGAARVASQTPSFYIESSGTGGLLPGAYPAPVFRQILDSIHAANPAR